ncbi:MAG TPA: dihydrofolate reductase family protein [Candidatus Saccharimonadales bacterium]|nr:dihydrofolate reductase family protein [Candidatus Saccharimonadales bacterium]
MRKIVVFNMISVDGYFAGLDGNIDWHVVDDEFNEFAIEHTADFGGIIFGRTTYELFEGYWPKALKDPKTGGDDRKIAQIIDDIYKFVFSKSLNKVVWKNTTLLHEIDPEEIKKWKQMDGKDIAIFGSGTIVAQFAKLGLIDEYRLMVNPVILGEGKSFFKGMDRRKLKLVKSREFKSSGNVLLYYQV